MQRLELGEFAIDTVPELAISMDSPALFPQATMERIAPHRDWLERVARSGEAWRLEL
jgi:hypothetical protein